jgi:hypothetical protein
MDTEQADYFEIPPEGDLVPPVGSRVFAKREGEPDRVGLVVAWGRDKAAHERFVQLKKTAGESAYEALVDSEGPIVEFDDGNGGLTTEFYPGQSVTALNPYQIRENIPTRTAGIDEAEANRLVDAFREGFPDVHPESKIRGTVTGRLNPRDPDS